jgi:hypothetical protein
MMEDTLRLQERSVKDGMDIMYYPILDVMDRSVTNEIWLKIMNAVNPLGGVVEAATMTRRRAGKEMAS